MYAFRGPVGSITTLHHPGHVREVIVMCDDVNDGAGCCLVAALMITTTQVEYILYKCS